MLFVKAPFLPSAAVGGEYRELLKWSPRKGETRRQRAEEEILYNGLSSWSISKVLDLCLEGRVVILGAEYVTFNLFWLV